MKCLKSEMGNVLNFGEWRRIRFISRCNNFPRATNEDVAQHSCFVTQLVMIIADELNESQQFLEENQPLNVESVLRKAIVHDVPEAFTSDIPYSIKHFDKDIQNKMSEMELAILNKAFSKTTDRFYRYVVDSRESKQDAEGEIVRIADMLELAWYCYEEAHMGNTNLLCLLDRAVNILVSYPYVKYSNFVKAAVGMFKRLLESNLIRELVL